MRVPEREKLRSERSSVVELHLAKVAVEGSNPFARSIFFIMKQLILIRHAKSSWDHPDRSDHERPLNERGRADAPVMAQWLAGRIPPPDLLISSTARRAQETARCFARALQLSTEQCCNEARIYEASLNDLLALISALPDRADRVLLVGHNPVISTCVGHLSDGAARSLPTCAIAALSFDISSWQEITRGCARLDFLVSPKHHP